MNPRRFLLLVALVITSILFFNSSPAGASSVLPTYVEGNPVCTGPYSLKLEGDDLHDGTWEVTPYLSITVSNYTGTSIDWSATQGIDSVIMKGGNGANVYAYNPEALSDVGLETPTIDGQPQPDISHIEFCFDYEVAVTKTAITTYDRSWDWTITKTGSPDMLLLGPDSHLVYYDVTVTAVPEDSNWVVTGDIVITNPSPFPATITGVADAISGGVMGTVSCGVTFPYNLVPGGTLECTYSAALPDGAARTNVATVSTTGDVLGNTATADLIFAGPTNEYDECIDLTDSMYGDLGTVCADTGILVLSIPYPIDMAGRPLDCGFNDVTNTASFATNDNGYTGEASSTVTVEKLCLEVTKTALPSYTRTWAWTIDKQADKTTMLLGDGPTEITYDVTVDATFMDSDWAVAGIIEIYNPHPYAEANIAAVTDFLSDGTPVIVSCPATVPPLGTVSCEYSVGLNGPAMLTNKAVVETTGYVGGGFATADIVFKEPTNLVDDCVEVADPMIGSLGHVCANLDALPVTFSYTHDMALETLECGNNYIDNTATFVTNVTGASASDSWTVLVEKKCLEVTKTADPTYVRTWDWTIDKTGSASELTLSQGQHYFVDYTVAVNPTATHDYAVAGTVTIHNPHPTADATITSLTDVMSPDISLTLNCPSDTVPAGGSLVCNYEMPLANGDARTNTVTVETTGFVGGRVSASADVIFGAPTQEIDECVVVTDSLYGSLGTVCAGDSLKTLTYQLDMFDQGLVCGTNEVLNTAAITENDTGDTHTDAWLVTVEQPCGGGCTLTPGYWKTHSTYGPAPYDDTWAMLGEDTPFYLSTMSYYQVLWTEPVGGNAYYILSSAYIAARLNVLNGASTTPEVDAAMAWANTYFETHTTAAPKGGTRADVIMYATLLDNYNNGLVGPGHCSE